MTDKRQASILIVENSRSVVEYLKGRIEKEMHLKVLTASTLERAQKLITSAPCRFSVGIFGLFLKDGIGSEVVEFALNNNIAPIIFTAKPDQDFRRSMWSGGIADYVIKDCPKSLDNVLTSLERFLRNEGTKVIVAVADREDSDHIARLLSAQNSTVLVADTSRQAEALFKEHTGIELAIIGGESESLQSSAFLSFMRKRKAREELAIIHIAERDKEDEAVQFIKYGADDYLCSPFTAEHFYCRVNNQLDTLEAFRQLRRASTTDFLTGANNRRFFMQRLAMELDRAVRSADGLSVVMMDADHFKRINDTYGHDVGDVVLKRIAGVVAENVRSADVFGRIGGEEFALALPGASVEEAARRAEFFRDLMSRQRVEIGRGVVSFTMSFGVSGCVDCSKDMRTAGQLLKEADTALYRAKENGRNQVGIFRETE